MDPEQPAGEGLALPDPEETTAGPWQLFAHNRVVLKAWRSLCQNTPANARSCYRWLKAHATKPHPGRCYALRGTKYVGVWAYEVGAGDRVYYKPNEHTLEAVVFYAGTVPADHTGDFVLCRAADRTIFR